MPKYDCFLSYNGRERASVRTVGEALDDEGLLIFYDEWSLVPGEPFHDGLQDALLSTETFAIFVGPHGFSGWQREELRVAIDRRVRTGARVIPVLLPGADPNTVPPFLATAAWVEFRTIPDPNALHRISCGIRGVPAGRPNR